MVVQPLGWGYVSTTAIFWNVGTAERKHLRYGIKKRPKKDYQKKGQRSFARKKQSLQPYTSPRGDIVRPIFHKDIPLSCYDLLRWCKYLKIPINNVLSRDETISHNHKQALFIYNLEPSYMSGSH